MLDSGNTEGLRFMRTAFLTAAALSAVVSAHGGELEKHVAENVLPYGAAHVSSASYAMREIGALDIACDEAWREVRSKAEYDAKRTEMRRMMMSAIGNMPERTPLNTRTVARYRRDGYSVEKLIFESMPGVFVTANLFIPDGDGKRPAIVMSCGHANKGKDAPVYLRACVIAVKQGFVALMFDPHYQGERRTSLRGKAFCDYHNDMGLRATLIDWSAPLLRIWDGMRAIDCAMERAEVDPERVCYMGQSGGGTMTALMQCADTRIKAAAPSCYLTSLRDLCVRMGPQDGEQNIFGQLSFGLNHTGYVLIPDIPVAVTAKFSDMFPWSGVQTLFKTAQTLERNVGIGERAFLNCAPGPHGWAESTETSSVMFLAKHMMPARRDEVIDLPSLWRLDLGYDVAKVDTGLAENECGCVEGRRTETLPGWRSIMDVIAERAAKARGARRPLDAAGKAEAVKRLAKVKTASEAGFLVHETERGEAGGFDTARIAFIDPKTGHTLPAVCAAKKGAEGAPVVVAAWGGRKAGLALAGKYLEEGRPVMFADVSGIGEIGAHAHYFYGARDRPDEGLAVMCYLMGEPLVGRRATEMLAFADAMSKRCGGKKPLLVASGPLAIPAAHAYAADPGAWSGVEVADAPASWRDCVEGGRKRMKPARYADVVPTAYIEYDWTELLP